MVVSGTELMQLDELVAGFPIGGLPDRPIEVTGIGHDSREIAPGDLFVAIVGERFDGRVFSREAVAKGAAAVLSVGAPPADFDGVWLTASSPRSLLAPLAARLFGHPDRELLMVGVTGTNGKSTVVAIVQSILEAAGRPTGRLGTLGYSFGDLELAAERTTPEGSELFKTLRSMRERGAEAVAMEVSSHALEQARLEAVTFDVGVFLNLSRDHFDYHDDFESYFAAKRRLFAQLKDGGRAVVNIDDPYGRRLAEELPPALTFGRNADVEARDSAVDENGIRGTLSTARGSFDFESQLLGGYNLDNIVAAAAVAVALDVDVEPIVRGIAATGILPGRMERVNPGGSVPVFIDYAHTDAALAAALESLRRLTGRRVLLVFGCGGDRDPGKRVLMGRVAGELADLPIVTSDNPRQEDPLAIIEAVRQGLEQSGNEAYRVIPDRRQAIRQAIAAVEPGWAVLIAGKGHEEVQIVGDQRLPFSDRHEVESALEERFGTAGG